MRRLTRDYAAVLTLGLAVLTWACDGNSSPTSPGSAASVSTQPGGASGGNPANGSLTVQLTDSPFSDARALLVTFSSVSVHRAEGDAWEPIPFASGTSRTCDLKKLNGPTDVLGVGPLPAGHYTQVRLDIASAALFFDNASAGGPCAPSIAAPAGTSASIDIPSGEVKLNHQFTVATGGTTMLLDFDGDQSVRQTGSGNANGNGNGNSRAGSSEDTTGKYMMSPIIRVVSVQ